MQFNYLLSRSLSGCWLAFFFKRYIKMCISCIFFQRNQEIGHQNSDLWHFLLMNSVLIMAAIKKKVDEMSSCVFNE